MDKDLKGAIKATQAYIESLIQKDKSSHPFIDIERASYLDALKDVELFINGIDPKTNNSSFWRNKDEA